MSLSVTQLIGFGAGAAKGLPSVTWTDKGISTADTNSYTFSSKSIGTAASGRRIVIAANIVHTTNGTTASCTIGGNSATSVVQLQGQFGGGGYVRSCLFILQVDSGTTDTVVITTSNSVLACGIGIWAIYDLDSSTATDTGSDNASAYEDTIDVSANGVLIATGCTYPQTTTSWTNVATEDYDETVETSFLSHSGAHELFASAQTARTITFTPGSGPSSAAFVMASFR